MATLLEYKCPCCNGAIRFDSSLQKMKCPYCDTEFDMETLRAYDEEVKQDGDENITWEEQTGTEWQGNEEDGVRVYVCNSCGGEIVGDENTAATSCPYCSNPVIMTGNLKGVLKPDYVIPFKLNKDMAKAAFEKHLMGKKLLPKVFRDETHIDEIKGVYIPFWLFDAKANARIRYKATRIRSWSDRNYDYTETRFYSLLRGGSIAFEHVPADGSSKMPDDLTESLEPFDFHDAVDFQTAYLSGYFADKYDVNANQSACRANERIKASTESAFAATANGYASVIAENVNIRLTDGKKKYALFPVWLLSTTWRDKKYIFAMNGQTGKFVGNLPIDTGAYCKWLFGLAGIIGTIAFALSYLIWIL